MRYLLYLPGIILILTPFIRMRRAAIRAERERCEREAELAAAAERRRIEAERKQAIQAAKALERETSKAAREAEQQRKRAERLEAARLRAEYAERELAAKREMKALERAQSVPGSEAEPVPPVPVFERKAEEPPMLVSEPKADKPPVAHVGNDAFKGQMVAFTGRLPGMTRREAIQAVRDNGGRAYEKMPVGTTLLVVGDKPGMCKMDKADEWIGQVRKITAAQFFAMLNQPLTLELDEFAAMFAA